MLDNQQLKQQIIQEVYNLKTESELTELWRKYLGKDGVISNQLKQIGNIKPEERREFGQKLNELKTEVDIIIENAKAALKDKNLEVYLNQIQVVLNNNKPKIGHIHPLTQTINEMNAILKKIGYSVMDGPEIETAEYNFERANLPSDHPAMDLQDSIYVEEPNILLRTQTTSIETHILEDYEPPFKVVMPGRTYRNEKVTKTNHFVFHQYQLTCVQEKVSMADLLATIEYLFKSFLGENVVIRFRNQELVQICNVLTVME
jgi:phenylalanyl-tRNA synthetase alpha chain